MAGATAVPAALIRRAIDELGCAFSSPFGQTEVHGIITQSAPGDSVEEQSETVGRPLPQVEVRIVDVTTGRTQPLGEPGEICCRGYQTVVGYHEMPEATAATIDADGWLHMGDLGTLDERGFLRVTGRLKDMVIRGGLNIYPREIEELLVGHPSIAGAAVVGVPDEKWGEQLAAVVTLAEGSPEPPLLELHEFCRQHMAAHKTPAYWSVVDELPVTGTGKIQKFALRQQIVDGHLALASAR